jgi:hypothetical protein
MPEDKIIKTGQLTWTRVLFLIACGVVLFIIVATGKAALGYILVTAVLCLLLFLVMIDYRVDMGTVDSTPSPAQQPTPIDQPVSTSSAVGGKEVRPRRRTSRPARRRR